ncbi:monovalent cation/H+ antiporter complex subunit F [Rubritalea tangerina]|uniref:Monovalent cation/H+ antiporter complex subunit F n=1 Tax=Rubritalea tangerina TaxID=430798 RepID=A0ABW4Z6T6_9BACT
MYFDIPELPEWVLTVSQYMLAVAIVLSAYRVVKGPTLLDRIIALDLLAALTMAQCVLLTLVSGFVAYLDIAIGIALISFIATVALVRYLERKDI